MSVAHIPFMQTCIELALKGRFTASPNPLVGCVLVKNDKVIAQGWHQKAGLAHAEINALAQAGNDAKGATAYVSLEPCCHQGKTGPCCGALITAEVSKVIFGMLDPNPLVAGQGIEKLKAAGIEVEGPVLEEECAAINDGFIKRISQGMPYVTCKLAMSLDGRTAMANGESKWITGSEAREDVQYLRAASDALISGIGTILVDDPSLNVRLDTQSFDASVFDEPLRVIVDSHLQTPVQAKTLSLLGEVLIATLEENSTKYVELDNVTVRAFAGDSNQVDLKALLKYLAVEKNCNSVLLESGAGLAGSMLKAGLVDELITYVAPSLMGSEAKPLFELMGLEGMHDKVALEFLDVAMLGKDCRMRSRVLNSENKDED